MQPAIDDEVDAEEEDANVVMINGRAVKMRKADCSRASREGRPAEPSGRAMTFHREAVIHRERQLKHTGRTKLTSSDYTAKRSTISSSGKGATVKCPAPENQAKLNHVANLKSKDVDTYNTEASYLLCDRTAEQHYDRLAENALRANAGNQAVVRRKTTQGASNQTPRINSKAIGQASAPQCVNVALAMAFTEDMLKRDGVKVRNPLGVVCVDPAALMADGMALPKSVYRFVPIICTTELIYNARPTKLGVGCILDVAKTLAKLELTQQAISERMSSANFMLDTICRSCHGGYEIDSVWAAIVLIVYLSCDPRGRPLLATTGLTDLDLQTAYVLEAYGRSEITRRARLAETQAHQAEEASKKRARKKSKVAESESDADEEDPDVQDVASPHSSNDDQRALATKKRRATRGLASASCSDAHGVIDYWFRALRSEEKFVLETLISSSRGAATEAAQKTLVRQAEGVADVAGNKTLKQMGESNAVKSVSELAKFVKVKPLNIPAIVAMKTKWDALAIGFAPVPQQASKSALHSCKVLDESLQPPTECKMLILHSSGVQEFAPRDTDAKTIPGIAERYVCMEEVKAQCKAPPTKGDARGPGKQVQVQFLGNSDKDVSFHSKRDSSRLERYIEGEARPPILSSAAGVTRSVIALRMAVPVNQSTLDAAAGLYDEAKALHAKHDNAASSSAAGFVSILGVSRKAEMRREPLCTPCSRLGVGIRLNELLRRWMAGRTRKNYPAMVLCGLRTNAEVSKDVPLISNTEPLPLAIMTDFSLKTLPGVTKVEKGTTYTSMGASMHVCIDGAVRVPELMPKLDNLFQRRALLYVAASQASYIGDVGSAVSAASANCSMANSKKVACPDINTLCLLTHFDVYVGGLTNVERSFINTPYTGTYGPRIDTGCTPPGLLANYYRSDHRGHGSISLSQEAADTICGMMQNSHHVEVAHDQYVTSPVQVRGIPHGLIPGVHHVLDDYADALEMVRRPEIADRIEEPTVDGAFVALPGPYVQCLAPDIEGTVDSTLRHAFRDPTQTSTATGRSYLPDATSEDEAIFVEPMWRRPCQASVGDNPFATSYDHADSMFNAANTIAGIILDIGVRNGMKTTHEYTSHFHDLVTHAIFEPALPREMTGWSYLWITDFLWLVFGVIYPHRHGIDEIVVPPSISKLSSAMARQCRLQVDQSANPVGAPLHSLLTPDELTEVRTLWARFSRRSDDLCAWKNGLEPLLKLIIDNRGGYDLSLDKIKALRVAVDNIPRSAFLVYSEDGRSAPPGPNPLSMCSGPADVRRPQLDPVFVATGDMLEIEPRGCLIGLKPFQLRQGYAMLMGAHMNGVTPQVVRNEGGLALRLSSAADILEKTGEERTDKAIAPLQTEADQPAFGTREAKLYGCALQRSAWDRNALAMTPLFASINPPQDKEKRARGEWGEASWLKQHIDEERQKLNTLDVESIAENQLHMAAKYAMANLKGAM